MDTTGMLQGTYMDLLAILVLLSFGIGYNHAVNWGHKNGWMEPYTAYWVAAGVTITILVAYYARNFEPVRLEWLLSCFVASGGPMIVGASARYVQAVRHDIQTSRDEANGK